MKQKQKEVQTLVGKFCKTKRETDLKMNLKTFSVETGMNYKTLFSFENGQSSNLYIFILYLNRASDYQGFIKELLSLLNEVE